MMQLCMSHSTERDNIRLINKINQILRETYRSERLALDNFSQSFCSFLKMSRNSQQDSVVLNLLDSFESYSNLSFQEVCFNINELEYLTLNQMK